MYNFVLLNLICYLKCNNDFPPYEFSCFISPFIIIPFLNWNNDLKIYKNILWLLFSISGMVIVEKLSDKENKEYNKQKLMLRTFVIPCLIIFNIFKDYLMIPDSTFLLLFSFLGYLLISCITQYSLINNLIKSEVPINDEEIKEGQEIKKMIKILFNVKYAIITYHIFIVFFIKFYSLF